MPLTFTSTARRLGMASALAIVGLSGVYAATLVVGLASLTSPRQPIGDPLLALLEGLILVLAPAMVALMAAAHAWGPAETKVCSLAALLFMALMAGLTCGVHCVLLTVGRQAEVASAPWAQPLLSFTWPSVPYALDVLAWDGFFPLSVLFAAPVFRGSGLARRVRALLVASGLLSLFGLSGVALGDMGLRNIGILGYCGVFPVATWLIFVLFRRTQPVSP